MSKSIMHRKDGTCYLCAKLHGGDFWHYEVLHEHHVIYGDWGALRDLSEHYGLKVYLCLPHHEDSKEAVHKNDKIRQMLCEDAQRTFEEHYPDLDFKTIFGKNYL